MNPTSRWRAALNLRLLTDATRETTLAGIQKVAPQSPLFQVPAVATAYAAVGTCGTTFATNLATAAANEKLAKVSAGARDASRLTLDLALATLKTAVENNASSATDVTSMGFTLLTIAKSTRTAPEAPAMVLVYPSKVHGKARVAVAGSGDLGHFIAEVSGDPIGTWASLPGNGKERKLSGYPSGTKLWVHFAQIRWGLQGPWSVPVLVTIP
jgi:hypothetical protein